MSDQTNSPDRINVLLVDDERSLLEPLTTYLSAFFAVSAAENSEGALQLVEENKAGFDVALIDESLSPGLNGIELMKAIRARYQNTEVIIFTGWGAEQRQDALRAGAFRYLEKPFNRDELVLHIRNAAQQVRLRAISGQMLATRGLGNLLPVIISAARSLIFADDAAVVVANPLTKKLITQKSTLAQSSQSSFAKHLLDLSLTRRILEYGEVFSIPDIALEKNIDPCLKESGYRAFIGLPIPGEEKNQGVLYVYSRTAHHFDELGHTALLRTITAQAGLALTNAWAEEQIENHSQNMEALVRASRDLSASDGLEDLYVQAWQFVKEHLGLKTFYIASYDSEKDRLSFPLYYERAELTPVPERSLGDPALWGLTGYVIKTGREVFFNNWADGIKICHENNLAVFINGTPTECCFYYPIRIDDVVVGVISVQSEIPGALSSIYLDTLRALGNHVSVAIKNIQLRQKENQLHLEAVALRQATLSITTTIETGEVIERVLDELRQVVPFDYASVQLLKGEGKSAYFEVISAQGFLNLKELLHSRYTLDHRQTYLEIYQSRRIKIIPDIQAYPDDGLSLVDSSKEIRSWMGVPLVMPKRFIGLITLGSKTAEFYTRHHAHLAEAFASSVAQALDNANHHQAIERANRMLGAMTEIMGILRSEKDPQKLLYETIRQSASLLDLKYGALFFYNAQLNQIELNSAYGFPVELSWQRIDAADSLAGLVAQTGELTVLNGDYKASYPADTLLAGYNLVSVVAVPIKHPNQPETKRVLLLADDTHKEINDTDQAILKKLADQAAITIRTSELISGENRHYEQLSILQKVNEFIQSRRPLDDILHVILTGITAGYGLGFNRAIMFLVDRTHNVLFGKMAIGYIDTGMAQKDWADSHLSRMDDFKKYLEMLDAGKISSTPLNERIKGHHYSFPRGELDTFLKYLAKNRFQEISSKDLDVNPELAAACEPGSRIAIVPLISNGEVIGLVAVDNKFTLAPITLEDEGALLVFANSAAVAIENERLIATLIKTREAELEVNKVSVLGNLPQTLATIRESAGQVLGCEMFTLYIYDQEIGKFTGRDHFGCLSDDNIRFPENLTEESTPYKVLNLREELYYCTEDSQNDTFFTGTFAKDEQIQATLAIKLVYQGAPLGVLFINYRQPHTFNKYEIDNALLFADQAAIAIQNARLFDRSQQQAHYLHALYEAGKVIMASLSLQDTLKQLAQQALILTGASGEGDRFCNVLLEENRKLCFEASAPEGFIAQEINLRNKHCGITGRVYKTGQSLLIDDVNLESDYIPFKTDTLSELAVPVIAGEKVIGVINVESNQLAAFRKHDQFNLELLAAQAGIAIQNARAYNDLRKAQRIIVTRTLLAFMGMSSSIWHHAIEKDALTISEQVDLFRMGLSKPVLSASDRDRFSERLDLIQKLARRIIEKPVTPPLNSEEGAESVLVTQLVKERASQLTERFGTPGIFKPFICDSDNQAAVWASPEWLRRALDILVDNAVKAVASRPVQEVTIGVRVIEDQKVQIFVRDTGVGIPMELQGKIGDEYIPKELGQSGRGMGLVMANLIAQAYHGDLAYTYTGSEGTEMTISFPIYQPDGKNS